MFPGAWLGLIALLAVGSPAAASPPDARWRTITTEHHRIHYPVEAEAWAQAVAGRMASIRAHVADEVGYAPTRRTQVVIRDPYATSNGMAAAFLRRPRIELWTTPPEASSTIGWSRDWPEMLMVHEDAHIVHLSRPSRGGVGRVLGSILGVAPMGVVMPRWAAEGYATVIEGDLTGYGRPYSAALSAELRRLATEGRLPTYAELDGSERWSGGGFAYGFGSAFLRWLRAREGEDSLRDLWTRMSAVELRTFDEAFEGVYGDTPQALYGRFCAELTLDAMLHERALPREAGTRWLDRKGGTGPPALSADGAHVAFISGGDKPQLQVWRTTFDADEVAEKRKKKVDELLEADPDDVPARVKPEPPLERAHTRKRRSPVAQEPRWIGSDQILFTGALFDREGRLRTDLFVWTPDGGAERRVTRQADLRAADPAPDGSWAVAVQNRWGATGLVRVDLGTGAVTPLDEPSIDRVVDHPRVSPDGQHILWLERADGRWQLMVRAIDGEARRIPTPDDAALATPSWHPDGDRILVAYGTDAFFDVVLVPLDGGEPTRLTASHGGALSPVATAEHLYWLDTDARGRDLHRKQLPEQGEPLPEAPELPLALTPPAPDGVDFTVADVESERYGLGRTELRPLLSYAYVPGDLRVELVGRAGDLLGRHELLVYLGGSRTKDGEAVRLGDGLRAALALRSLPFTVHAEGFAHRVFGAAPGFLGGAVSVQDRHLFRAGVLRAEAGGVAAYGLDAPSRFQGFAGVGLVLREPASRWVTLRAQGRVAAGQVGDALGGWGRAQAELAGLNDAIGIGAGISAALGGAGPLTLGGLREATLPDVMQIDRVIRPAFLAQTGSLHASASARLGPSEAALFIERHLIGDQLRLDQGATVVGFQSDAFGSATPFAKVPAVEAVIGVGCRLELPGQPIRRRPCNQLTDYVAWSAVSWRL